MVEQTAHNGSGTGSNPVGSTTNLKWRKQMSETKRSLLDQVRGERIESKRKAAKSKLKELLDEYEKSEEVRKGIEAQMSEVLAEFDEEVPEKL